MKATQKQRIIQYINKNGKITSYEAYAQLGITQLATRIKELKELGYIFYTYWIKKENRYGEEVSFKAYSLKKEGE